MKTTQRLFVLLSFSIGMLLTTQLFAGVEVYEAIGVDKGKVISGTQASAKVLPSSANSDDDEKQIVCLVSYFTGKKDKANAVNLKLAVLREIDGKLQPIWVQDFGAKYGGFVGDGDLQLFDLDRDGQSEMIVSFDLFSDPLIKQRLAEVIVWEEKSFKTGWSGEFEYDATKAVRDVPVERRDRYVRELDLANTLRTRGVTLFFNKTMISVAGERLAEPKVIEETFPLRTRLNF
jgi:hypothetical protein